MRDRCEVPRTLFQCVCTQHRNRTGRLSPFSEYAPSASRFKPDRSLQSKVTHYPDQGAQHCSNGKRLAPCGMHIGLLMRPTYVDGNDVDVNRFKREVSAEPVRTQRPTDPTRVHTGIVGRTSTNERWQAEDCGRQMTYKHSKRPRDNTTPAPKKPR